MGATPHPRELGPNKFQDMLFGASIMQKKPFSDRGSAPDPVREITTLPQTP